MDVRRAEPGDLPGVREIASSYGNLDQWPTRPDYLDFELELGGLWVAVEGGAVAGFAGLVDHDDRVHLADLFVRRDAVARGIGSALLRAALPTGRPLTTLAALSDPRALPLYARAGMQPLAPVVYLEGRLDGGGEARRVDVSEVAGAQAFLAGAGAYGLTTEGGAAVVRPAAGVAHLGPAHGDVVAIAAAASAAHGAVALALPGPHPALRPLLDAGLRMTSVDAYMATAPGLVDLERYAFEADLG